MSELSKQALKVDNNTSFPNNNTNYITPALLRGFNENMIDSMVDEIPYQSFTQSVNASISSLSAQTASYVTSAITASSLITASFNTGTRNLTFTKGDTSTFSVNIPDVSGSSGDFVTTSSFNAYTASNDTKWSNLGSQSGSWITESETGSMTVLSASFAISSSHSELADDATNSTFSVYADNTIVYGKNLHSTTIAKGTPLYFTGSGTNGNLVGVLPADASNPLRMPAGGVAGESLTVGSEGIILLDGFINGVDTSAFQSGNTVYVGVGGGYTNVRPTGSTNLVQALGYVEKAAVNGSGVIKGSGRANDVPNIAQGYAWVGNSNGVAQAVATSSFAGTSINTGSFATTGSNTFVGQQTIQNTLEIQEAGNPLIYTQFVQQGLTGKLAISQAGGTGVHIQTDLGVDGTFTSSLQQGYTFVGDASGRTTLVATSSFGSTINTGSFATTGSNLFTGNQRLETSANSPHIQLYQGSLVGGTQSNAIQFREGSSQNPSSSYYNIQVTPGDQAWLAFTEQPSNIKFIQLVYSSSASSRSVFIDVPISTGTGNPISINKETEITGSLNVSSVFTASLQEGYVWVGDSSGKTSLVATSSFSSTVSGFATTGSNVFTGDQTLVDAGGNSVTLTDTSGSLMLVAKSFTSASAHFTSSVNQVNIIIKSNNNTADTVISGSNNIFANPATPTTGFRRYYSNANISLQGGAPQISASMAFSPTISGNTILSNANPITIRGPVSSSTYTIQQNVIAGGSITLGTAAGTNYERAINGTNINQNIMNGSVSVTAYKTAFTNTSAMAISSNIIGGTVTLNADSSSISLAGNTIQNSNFIVNNSYYNASATGGGNSLQITQGNAIFGTSTLLFSAGSNTTAATGRQFTANIIAGTFNSASLNLSGDNSNIFATAIIGHNLSVTGSSALQTAAPARNSTYGSAFFGRFNAQDGTKALTAETVFAVGTGTTSAAKTGFLIDSGSNSYFEGTLNVSGSSTFTGSVGISQVMNLKGQDPLPTGALGDLAVSGSNLYFYNGAWTLII